MSMKITIAAFAAFLLAAPVRADDAKSAPTATESVMTFFRHLKDSLAQSAVQGQRKRARVGSVAAVRGGDQSSPLADPNEPVLKGDARSRKDKAAAAEDAEFTKAVDLVLAGKTDDGVRALEAFKSNHPKSRSLDKVQQAIDATKGLLAQKSADAVPPPAAATIPAPASAVKPDAPAAAASAAPAGK